MKFVIYAVYVEQNPNTLYAPCTNYKECFFMKKRKILTRGITTALAVVSVFFVSHYAKAGENYIKTGEKVDFTELYDSKEFSTDNSKVTLSKDNKTDGLFVDYFN